MAEAQPAARRAADGSAVVDLDTPSSDKGGQTVKPEEIAGLQDQITKLTETVGRQSENIAAERQGRRRAEAAVVDASAQRLNAQEAAVTTGIANAETALAALEQQLEIAMANGDAKNVAKITGDIAEARVDLKRFKEQKVWVENERKKPVVVPGAVDVSDDPRLAPYAAFPSTVAWIRRNPQFLTDPKFKSRAEAYHKLALTEGHPHESDAYWQFIDDNLAGTKGVNRDPGDGTRPAPRGDLDQFDHGNADLDTAAARAASRGARPSRAGGTDGADLAPNQVRLTAAEQEAAEISFPEEWKKNPQEAMRLYARNKLALVTEGRLPNR